MSLLETMATDSQVFYGFTVETKSLTLPTGDVKKMVTMNFIDEDIKKMLGDITEMDEFYSKNCSLTPEEIYPYFKDIKTRAENGKFEMLDLAAFLGELYKDDLEKFNNMSNDGKVTFATLGNLFNKGERFISEVNGKMIGGIIDETSISTGPFGEKYFVITGLLNIMCGNKFAQFHKRFSIPEFRGTQHIESLNVRPISDEEYELLTERNKRLLKYLKPFCYTGYKGNMFVKTQFGLNKFNATGRVIVDFNGFKQFNPNYGVPQFSSSEFEHLSDDMVYMLYPFMYGYSLNNKRWGEIDTDCLCDINFDSKAFDYLVLDDSTKKLMKALVLNVNTSFSDVITGKSGGCIFLLHGPPGVGKTLSCEAISELLQRPLYSITVGELGTDPDDLEKRLGRVLEIANSWDAIILLDEADIFMEKRSSNDVHRNAMVSIFLRLLERHQGVMFLTTNRMENIDEAFRSRISTVIEYKNLDQDKRIKVWNNLLKAAKITLTEDDVKQLSKENINGRQIKNVIRTAQCLSKDEQCELTMEIFNKVINLV